MKRIATAVCVVILLSVLVERAESQAQKPAPEQRNADLWVGDWTMVGTAKDTPTEPEYEVVWNLHGSRILGGSFVRIDHIWRGKGPEQQLLEILSYDPVNRTHAISGFGNDGSTWVSAAKYDDDTVVDSGTTTAADRKVTKWRETWVFSDDGMAVSATEESERDGTRWTSFTMKGTKAKTPARTR